jgi:hypothetical protein
MLHSCRKTDCCYRTACSHYVYDAGEVVGEYVPCHLGSHARQRLHQEVVAAIRALIVPKDA